MGRPPSNGAPSFRFNPNEVTQMEAVLREHQGQIPARELIVALAEKFSNSPERAGKITVQMKQVCNWFQNKRFALRSKLVKSPGKLNISPVPRKEVAPVRNAPPLPQQIHVSSGHNMVKSTSETPQMEFEAKSARDGAWYDVQAFLSHRYLETGNPEVLVRFTGFGQEEDEWINVCKHVRQRSLPCEASECVAVLPGDLILCFQEGKEQALYFDAHVLDAQRRRHDIRGCRCRFLVWYGHDQSEEIVPLRKICRRPETDYRLQQLNACNEAASADPQKCVVAPSSSNTFRVTTPKPKPTSAAITVPLSHISSATPAPIPSPAPTQTPTPIPVPVSVSAPVAVPVSASIPTPVPISASIPAPVPVYVSVPTPVPVSTSILSPVQVSASVPAPVPVSALIPAPVQVSAPIPVPVSVSAPIPAPVPVSASILPSPVLDPFSVQVPVPDYVSVPVAVSVSASGQVPVTVPAPGLIPVSVPETNKVENNGMGVLVGRASAEANIVSPSVGSVLREPDKGESTDLETATLTGSINLVITA